ncbi:MAG: hypothetical protein KY464_17400 [Gemmatimonadetes bacterium]|nr:hypothetical protein [Gemmatimonadota bacterium]
MELTAPVSPAQLQLVYPRDTRGMSATPGGELEQLLRLEERTLRSLYGVVAVDADSSAALADAMLAAWPSFIQQVRQVASEDTGSARSGVTYNRPGVIDFAFPSFVGTILASVADPAEILSAPAVTQLVR